MRDLRACAVAADDPADEEWLGRQWQGVEDQIRGYVTAHVVPGNAAAAADASASDPGLRSCIEAITRSLHLRILREDLDSLAAAVRSEAADGHDNGAQTKDASGAQAADAEDNAAQTADGSTVTRVGRRRPPRHPARLVDRPRVTPRRARLTHPESAHTASADGR